jgi:hypothetical protein
VHATGFIGGAWSMESAIGMAVKSLEEHRLLESEKIEEVKKIE